MNPIYATLPALALALAMPAHASKKTEAANVETVRSITEGIWNDGNVDMIDTAFGGDVDKEKMKEFVTRTNEMYEDFSVTIDDIWAKDDKVVSEWTASGTHGHAGTKVTVDGITVSTVTDGVVTNDNVGYDRLAVFEQVGMDPFEMAAEHNMMAAKAMVEKVYNAGEYDAAGEMMAEGGYKLSTNGAEAVAVDGEGLKKSMEGWTDAKLNIEDMIARGDKVVVRWSMTGNHAALGEDATMHGTWIGQFAEGKLTAGWQMVDTAAVVEATKN